MSNPHKMQTFEEHAEAFGALWPSLKNDILLIINDLAAGQENLSDSGAVAKAGNAIILKIESALFSPPETRGSYARPKLRPHNQNDAI